MTQIVAMFIALAGLCVLLYGLEWMFPSARAQPLWRSDSKIDAWYLLFTPFVTRWISKLVALAGVVIALHVLGRSARLLAASMLPWPLSLEISRRASQLDAARLALIGARASDQ
jgi:hypothetical protein